VGGRKIGLERVNSRKVTEAVLHQAVIAQYDYRLSDQDLIPTMDRISLLPSSLSIPDLEPAKLPFQATGCTSN
jgi:hypothetical protein